MRRRIMAMTTAVMLVIAMIPEMAFAEKVEQITEEHVAKWAVTDKTEDTTTYELSNGSEMTVFHGEDVRFENENGVLKDYDPSLKEIEETESKGGESLAFYAYENAEGDSRQYLPVQLDEETPVLLEKDGNSMSISLTEESIEVLGMSQSQVQLRNEVIEDPYEKEEEVPVAAVYTSDTAEVSYVSLSKGVKENIVLMQRPLENVFTYKLKLEGLWSVLDEENGCITLFDEEGDMKGAIERPFMNDAGGNAYSEEIDISMGGMDGPGEYVLEMTVSRDYLDDPVRQYPVTIDPLLSWSENTRLKDAYVANGSAYRSSNFYSSGVRVMPVGYGSKGTYRTYLKLIDFRTALNELSLTENSITGAKLRLYCAGQEGTASRQAIEVRRVLSSWSPGTITWDTQPSYAQNALSSVTVGNTKYKAYAFDVLSYVKRIARGDASYGMVLVNRTSPAGYMSFIGSRSTTSYKPSLRVTYERTPSEPADVSFSDAASRTGKDILLQWEGIPSGCLDKVRYRIEKKSGSGWTSTRNGEAGRTGSGSMSIPGELEEGTYRAAVWGVNSAGVAGPEKLSANLIVDKTAPQMDDIILRSPSGQDITGSWSQENDPQICISGITDNGSIGRTNIKYQIVKDGQAGTYKSCSYVSFGSTDPNAAVIRLSEEERALGSGRYAIKVRVRDKAGNSVVKTASFLKDTEAPTGNISVHEIENRLDAPALSESYPAQGRADVSLDFGNDAGKIDGMEYRIDGDEWQSLQSGHIFIEPQEEGRYTFEARGIDSAGVHTKTSLKVLVCDRTMPQASLTGIQRGRVTGIASDENLTSWKILYRVRGTGDPFSEAGISGSENAEGNLGVLDSEAMADDQGLGYEIKLMAEDMAGQVSEDVMLYFPSGSLIKSVPEAFRVKRPSYCSDEGDYVLPSGPQRLSLKQDAGAGEASWYIDGQRVQADVDFDAYDDGGRHCVLAEVQTDGGILRSSIVFENALEESIQLTGGQEEVLHASEDFTSFRVIAPENAGIEVRLSSADEAALIEPGQTVSVSMLSGGSRAYADEIHISGSSCRVQILYDCLQKECFTVDELASYIPQSLSVKERMDSRNYLYWEDRSGESISYRVYRGKSKDFTPSEETLAADAVKAGFFCDMNLGENCYYKVTAVKTGAGGDEESLPSKAVRGRADVTDDLVKRLGITDYWQYLEFNTPNGKGGIEESQGNFTYSQEDMSLESSGFETGLTRTYNSMSKEKGAFGLGWTSCFDIRLLSVHDNNEDEKKNLVMKDGTGTAYRFIKGSDGSFISSQGEYMSLLEEETTTSITVKGQVKEITSSYTLHESDNIDCYFSSGGQLLLMKDTSGSFLEFEYQPDIGLLEKVTTEKGVSIGFRYDSEDPEGDILLIKSASMPDGSSRRYSYDETSQGLPLLREVKDVSADGDEISYEYLYDTDEHPQMRKIKDAEGKGYRIFHDEEGRTCSVQDPCGNGHDMSYEEEGSVTRTQITAFRERGFFSSGKITEETSSTFEKNTGYQRAHTDDLGNTTSFEYVDGVCVMSSGELGHYRLTEDSRIENAGTSEWSNETELGSKLEETSMTYEDGSFEELEYEDAENGLVSSDILYDEEGNVLESSEYGYDENGNETYEHDAVEDVTETCEYDDMGEPVVMREYLGDSDGGDLVSETRTSISYGEGGEKEETEVHEECGVVTVTRTCTDSLGRELSETVSEDGQVQSSRQTEYDGFGRVARQTETEDGFTCVTVNEYDRNGQPVRTVAVCGSGDDTEQVTCTYAYDDSGRPTMETVDDNGEITWTTTEYTTEDVSIFDTEDGRKNYENVNVVRTMDEDGNVMTESFTTESGLTVREREAGVYTDHVYDGYGTNIATYVAGADPENENGHLAISIIDEKGRVTDIIKDPEKTDDGYIAGEKSIVNSSEYDAAGRVTAGTDGNGGITRYSFDEKGDLSSVTLPGGETTTWQREDIMEQDELLSRVMTVDARGNVSIRETDSLGNVRKAKDILEEDGEDFSILTEYTYDDQGRCIEEREAAGNRVTYVYDRKGNVSTESRYGQDGRLASQSTYVYDMKGNLGQRRDFMDSGGQLVLCRSVFMTHDRQGRLKSSSTIEGPAEPSESEIEENAITYSYDRHGNLTDVDYSFKSDGARGLKYIYDVHDRIVRIKVKDGLIADTMREYQYDGYGRVSEVRDHYDTSGADRCMVTKYTYDQFDRLSSQALVDENEGKVREAWLFRHDKNGNIIREESVTAFETGGSLCERIRQYSYDENGRLTRVILSEGENGMTTQAECDEMHEYTYDASGNRTSFTNGDLAIEYVYNGLDQLIEETESCGDETLSHKVHLYDRNGNEISSEDTVTGELRTMTYDESDMMSGCVISEGGTVKLSQENLYDPEGKRVQKKEEIANKQLPGNDADDMDGTITDIRNYMYQNGSLLAVSDGQGSLTSFNLLDLSGDAILTLRDGDEGEESFLYNRDHKESVSSITDENGNAVAAYVYDEYGNTEELTCRGFDNEICYTGQILDSGTGLYYYSARYYDSSSGRFTTQDTDRGDDENPLTLNLYTYCAGNPINYTDPTGHSWLGKAWGRVKRKARKVKRKIKRKARKAKHAVKKKVRHYKKKAKKTYRKIKKKVKYTAKKVAKKTQRKYSKAKAAAKGAFNSLKDKIKLKINLSRFERGLTAVEAFDKAAGKASVATSAIGVAATAYKNINSGESIDNTISDAMVDISFEAGLYLIGVFLVAIAGGPGVLATAMALVGCHMINVILSDVKVKNNKSIRELAKRSLRNNIKQRHNPKYMEEMGRY